MQARGYGNRVRSPRIGVEQRRRSASHPGRFTLPSDRVPASTPRSLLPRPDPRTLRKAESHAHCLTTESHAHRLTTQLRRVQGDSNPLSAINTPRSMTPVYDAPRLTPGRHRAPPDVQAGSVGRMNMSHRQTLSRAISDAASNSSRLSRPRPVR